MFLINFEFEFIFNYIKLKWEYYIFIDFKDYY